MKLDYYEGTFKFVVEAITELIGEFHEEFPDKIVSIQDVLNWAVDIVKHRNDKK